MSTFRCSSCGATSVRAELLCPQCEAANAYQPLPSAVGSTTHGGGSHGGLVRLSDVSAAEHVRTPTGIAEFDRVAGGGLVAGSLILLAGEPGAGKSTLLAQVTAALVAQGKRAIYITGEESAAQIRMRAQRLGLDLDALEVLATGSVTGAAATIADERPDFVVIDSVQAMEAHNSEGVAGGMSQMREVASVLARTAKSTNTTLLLVGHITKDASVAGPKSLEHLVDAVFMLEGDRHTHLRVLRASKNRYGAIDEIGLFEMRDHGMFGVPSPTPLDVEGGVAFGRALCPIVEGTRPILVEVQALVAKAVYGTARRIAMGVPEKRVAMLLAVLERYAEMDLSGHDVYVQVSSGITVTEPAIDAAICAAIASSYWSGDEPHSVPAQHALVGEVGLGGELRPVRQLVSRGKESGRLGVETLIGPAGKEISKAVTYTAVSSVAEMLTAIDLLAPEGATPVQAGSKRSGRDFVAGLAAGKAASSKSGN